MKKLFALLISLTLLYSCGAGETDETERTEQISETESQAAEETAPKPDGVYYPPVSEREVGYVFSENAVVCFAFSYLYYNGSMYTSSYVFPSLDKAEAESFADKIRESELAEVYSNREQFWAEDVSKLSYADENINGTIYSMAGYDEDFRVCVCYERYIETMDETYYGFIVFDKLNDITVNKGSDLFKDRLHLDEYAEVRIMRTDENDGNYEEKLSGDFSELVQAMLDGKFIEADYDTRENFRKRESYTLIFYTETGLNTTVSVYPEGYVSMTYGGNTFIEKISSEACSNVIKYISGGKSDTVETEINTVSNAAVSNSEAAETTSLKLQAKVESSAAEVVGTEIFPLESGYCTFDSAEHLSESEIIALAEQVRDGFKQSDLIKDHIEFDDMGIPFDGSYDTVIIPSDADFEEYCSDEKNFPMYHEEEYENGVLEKLGENDIYSQWRNAYTEIRRMYIDDVPTVLELDREYRRLFLKNFVRNEQNTFVYTGKMNSDDIVRNFDILTYSHHGMKICRRVAEADDCFTYEFYCVRIIGGDWGLNDEAVIEGKSIEILKKDGSFNSEGKIFYEASCEIPDTAPRAASEWDD